MSFTTGPAIVRGTSYVFFCPIQFVPPSDTAQSQVLSVTVG